MKAAHFFCVAGFLCGLMHATAYGQTDSAKPFVLGVVEEIQSTLLHEKRILNIYLPEGYHADDTIRYPVIYLLDGGADEDFIHVAGLVQFNSFPWVGRLPPSIVVGIANTDRRRDFTFPTTVATDKTTWPTTGGSEHFMAFIEKELQPFIHQKYLANGDKTLVGESLGGLLATEVLQKNPGLFNRYIIISPSLWWNDGSILRDSFSLAQKTEIYIGVGKEGLAPSEKPHVMEEEARALADLLKKHSENAKVYFDYHPDENHATIGHIALYCAFRMLYAAPDANAKE